MYFTTRQYETVKDHAIRQYFFQREIAGWAHFDGNRQIESTKSSLGVEIASHISQGYFPLKFQRPGWFVLGNE